ncbi:hypothetical protein CH361_19170 [Leptospira brenneri]|nr:hypothetical protein CH361_19170 [Leptospira brenneri]
MSNKSKPLRPRHQIKKLRALILCGLSETRFNSFWDSLLDLEKERFSSKELASLAQLKVKELLPLSKAKMEEYVKNQNVETNQKKFLEVFR